MPQASSLPDPFTPMLAGAASEPFDSADFWFEVKWDGVRVLAFCEGKTTRLFSRTRRDVTASYPELAGLGRHLRVPSAVIDGEIFALSGGRPSFGTLQQRIGLSRPGDIQRASSQIPVQMACFDLVWASGTWLGDLPLEDRYEALRSSVGAGGPFSLAEPVAGQGVAFFEAVRKAGLEGVMAKRIASRYLPGRRSPDWIKIKVAHRMDCVIAGWNPGEGSRRARFGSLLLGAYDEAGALRYLGSVGTGFTDLMIDQLWGTLCSIEVPASSFSEDTGVKGARWVRPDLVADVEFREITFGGRLRAPAFKGLRLDKAPQECLILSPQHPAPIPD